MVLRPPDYEHSGLTDRVGIRLLAAKTGHASMKRLVAQGDVCDLDECRELDARASRMRRRGSR